MEARKRHSVLWTGIRPIVTATAKLLFNYSADICDEEGPLLIMANHNADLDPLLVAYSFPRVLYFVASEHVMRGWAGRFLSWATDIIPRQKGGSAASTVRGIMRHTRDGHDVCIFPEGNRSWDGVTRRMIPSTGKMARMSKAKLVTYRIEGAYFSSPRWSGASMRRGRAHGTIVGVYDHEQLSSMTPEQVQELIERDLAENAYERQKKVRVRFRGKHLAEHLETLLFKCPHCGTEGKMRSEGDRLICDDCGTSLRFTPEGLFEGENAVFDNVLDWSKWQNERIREKCEAAGDEVIFSDTDMQLYRVNTAEREEFVSCGSVRLYRDRLELPAGLTIPTDGFTGMSILGPQTLFFSSGGKNYVLKSSRVRCVSKYLTACSFFDEKLSFGI